METQTVALLLLLAAIAASGLMVRALTRFLYSGLPMSGERWAMWPVYVVRQVHTAQWPAIVLQLGLASAAAVRSADVDLWMIDAHADPAMLPVPSSQDDVTL
jgi:hypothetical protein